MDAGNRASINTISYALTDIRHNRMRHSVLSLDRQVSLLAVSSLTGRLTARQPKQLEDVSCISSSGFQFLAFPQLLPKRSGECDDDERIHGLPLACLAHPNQLLLALNQQTRVVFEHRQR